MNDEAKNPENNAIESSNLVGCHRPVMTSEKRQRLREWSKELNKLDHQTMCEEVDAWIQTALSIVEAPND